MRGGVFKPRTSPYSFQGLGEEGLEYLAEAREETGLPIVVEIMSQTQLDLMVKYVDVLQVGARNMQNFNLLRAIGETRKSVLLKRGLSATIEELLMSAEYILAGGNKQVMLCERGIRTFETATRNTTDINAIPVLKNLTHLPVILDPSHATGHADYVTAIARAGDCRGRGWLIVEVHPDPAHAVSDGKQSLKPETFVAMVKQVGQIAQVMGRSLVSVNGAYNMPSRVGRRCSFTRNATAGETKINVDNLKRKPAIMMIIMQPRSIAGTNRRSHCRDRKTKIILASYLWCRADHHWRGRRWSLRCQGNLRSPARGDGSPAYFQAV